MNFSLSGGNPDSEPVKKDKKAVEKHKKDWFDWWLNDDPPAPAAKEELRKNRVEKANTYKPRGSKSVADEDSDKPAPTNVTININLSKLKVPKIIKPKVLAKRPKLKPPALPYKRITIIVVGLVIVLGPASWFYKHHQQQAGAKRIAAANQALSAQPARATPSFTPVAPKDKPNLGVLTANSKDIAYDGNRDTYSFIDTFDANNLTVSEQPLPTGSGMPAQVVAKVANQISAKTPILLDGGNVAYMYSDDKSGAQTVVFSINGLLIFINSAFHHDAADYKAYIENLQ